MTNEYRFPIGLVLSIRLQKQLTTFCETVYILVSYHQLRFKVSLTIGSNIMPYPLMWALGSIFPSGEFGCKVIKNSLQGYSPSYEFGGYEDSNRSVDIVNGLTKPPPG